MLVAVVSVAAAQGPDPTGALELERLGRYEEAIRVHRRTLESDPANIQALLGLERLYTKVGRPEAIATILSRAEEAAPRSEPVRELQIRVWSSLKRADSVAAAAARWMNADPTNPSPYQLWAWWLAQRGDLEQAKRVLEEGRRRLGEDALVEEMGQLLVMSGDWLGATRVWRHAVRNNEPLIPAAAASLQQVPEDAQPGVLRLLTGDDPQNSDRRFAADLLVTWGRPDEGWTLLDSALPNDRAAAIIVLKRFAERARQVRTLAGARARGYALERLSQLTTGAEAERVRVEAAQSFADAGDLGAARRMLGQVAIDRRGRGGDAPTTIAALIRVLADAGRVDEGEDLFRQWHRQLRGDDVVYLQGRLAWARVRQGELDRAEKLVGDDSSVSGQALLGWIALYRGDLRAATDRFRRAGPYAQSREEATRRTAALALIQRITPERMPALGAALLELARGDTARAVRDLADVARSVSTPGGRAAVLGFAGEAAVASGDYEGAEALLRGAIAADSTGPAAPAAQYALAASYAKLGKPDAAAALLEDLILSHPESAVVPQARRLLDQVRGNVPKS